MLIEKTRLDGKVALVVGGGGAGIGGNTSLALAQAGACVIAADVSDDALAAVADLLGPTAVKWATIKADVSREDDIALMLDRALAEFGRIDVLVNVAGGTTGNSWGPMIDKPSSQWDTTQMLNLKYCYLTGTRVARHLIDAGRPGSIVHIASMSAYTAPNHAAYGAAKAGLISLTRSMAIEWAGHGIRVNAISPGPIDTPRTRSRTSPEMLRRYNELIPFGRKGTAEEIACAVLYLATDLSSYVTGHNLVVDGGCTIKFSGMGPATG